MESEPAIVAKAVMERILSVFSEANKLRIKQVISFVTKDWVEAGVILFVIIINTLIGFLQEYRAEKTMESLRRTASPTARVVRNGGHIITIAAKDLVPGDIIVFEGGDAVAGDARVIQTFNLETDEAMLTGESLPVGKDIKPLHDPNQPLADRHNMIYLGTNIVKGRGRAVIVQTGMKTQIGRIATYLVETKGADTTTPLQKRLNKLALILFGLALLLAVVVFGANKFKFTKNASIYAVSVGIAMIPEGLVAVVTLTMALGVRRMASEKAIVRKLAALETLGNVNDICSDKTGTLTQGKMVLTKFYIPEQDYYAVSGAGINPTGEITSLTDETKITASSLSDHPNITRLVEIATFCNTSTIRQDTDGTWIAVGDPTEVALTVLGRKLGYDQKVMTASVKEGVPPDWEILEEFPFDSSLKRMSVIFRHTPHSGGQTKYYVFAKGSLEAISKFSVNDVTGKPLDMDDLHNQVLTMGKGGLRVLALAYRELDASEVRDSTEHPGKKTLPSREDTENGLIFVGLAGINDPPRAETAPAVAKCHKAGITVRMLTGDHPVTASAIAKQIGILTDDSSRASGDSPVTKMTTVIQMDGRDGNGNKLVWTGNEFDALTDTQVDDLPELPLVVARCTPETKVKMIEALERRDKIAAMTGDGVNDSPSLKKAPVGIAMGLAGSDVAKNASDIVLTDDNFATIVQAVAQGRRIFANIQKFVLHLMTTNVAEIVALIIGLVFLDGNDESVYPMSPLQILFANMITSSPPAMALGIERPMAYQMSSPRYRNGPLFTWTMIIDIFFYGILMGGLILSTFTLRIYGFGPGDSGLGVGCNEYHPDDPAAVAVCSDVYKARGTAFVTLTWIILIHAYVCRHPTSSMFGRGKLYDNPALFWTCVIGAILVFPALYIPGVTRVFKHEGLSWEWGMIAVACVVYVAGCEAWKWVRRRRDRKNGMAAADSLEEIRVGKKEEMEQVKREEKL
ncbi:Na P-type ATPase [Gaertneriomyces semiglobifer]|nr:Na P-type ATPase [Gaertneriomyces semiglobifer]